MTHDRTAPRSNDELPLVSIAITSYNYGRYIERAIRSAMEQTYHNLEILISDNASTDDSAAIVERLAAEDPRIRFWVNPTNIGMHANFRLVRDACRGEYVALLSADDFIYPDHIERAVSYYLLHPACDIRYAPFVTAAEDGAELRVFEHPSLKTLRSCSPRDELAFALGADFHITAGMVVFRRDVLERAGHFTDDLVAADHDFFFRCNQLGMRFAFEAHPTYAQRHHALEMSAPDTFVQSGAFFREYLTLLDRYLTPEAIPRCVGRRKRIERLIEAKRGHMLRMTGERAAELMERERELAERVAAKVATIPDRLSGADASFPRFSIVLPTMGNPVRLKRSIDSILAQTESSWELILVSSNGRAIESMAREWVGDRLVYAEPRTTLNPAAARNVALLLAQGESIAYLDEGDTWHPQYLQAVALGMDQHGADLVRSGAGCSFYESSEDAADVLLGTDAGVFAASTAPFVDAAGLYAPLSAVAHRSSLTDELRFDESLSLFEDWAFLARITRTPGLRVANVSDLLVQSAYYSHLAQQQLVQHLRSYPGLYQSVAGALGAVPAVVQARLGTTVAALNAYFAQPSIESLDHLARVLHRPAAS